MCAVWLRTFIRHRQIPVRLLSFARSCSVRRRRRPQYKYCSVAHCTVFFCTNPDRFCVHSDRRYCRGRQWLLVAGWLLWHIVTLQFLFECCFVWQVLYSHTHARVLGLSLSHTHSWCLGLNLGVQTSLHSPLLWFHWRCECACDYM